MLVNVVDQHVECELVAATCHPSDMGVIGKDAGLISGINKNNILIVDFNNTGLVENKKIIDLNNMNDVKYVKKITQKEFDQDNTIVDCIILIKLFLSYFFYIFNVIHII